MNTNRPLLVRTISGAVAGALMLASCGEAAPPESVGTAVEVTVANTTGAAAATDVPTTTDAAPATEAPTTTVAPTTTAAPSTTAAPTTTAPAPTTTAAPPGPAPSAAELVLTTTGIGPLAFSAADPATLIAALTPALGVPTRDSTANYPSSQDGYFFDPATEEGFDHPAGRTICFANELCAHFGGPTTADVRLVGYTQRGSAGALATPSGVTIGSVWASFTAVMTVDEGGCYTTGSGTADGVDAVLQSTGEWFLAYDPDTDTYTTNVPDPADVTVTRLSSGSQPFYLFEDC